MSPEQTFLFDLNKENRRVFELKALRNFQVHFNFCTRCYKDKPKDVQKMTFYILEDSNTLRSILTYQFKKMLCREEARWRLSSENTKNLTKDSLLIDLPPDEVINLETVHLSKSFFRSLFRK